MTVSIEIDLGNLEQLIGRIVTGMPQATRNALQQTGDFLASEMRNNAHVITGRMKNSIVVEGVTDDSVTVAVTAPYAIYENARVGGIQGPHDFATRAVESTRERATSIFRTAYDELLN